MLSDDLIIIIVFNNSNHPSKDSFIIRRGSIQSRDSHTELVTDHKGGNLTLLAILLLRSLVGILLVNSNLPT